MFRWVVNEQMNVAVFAVHLNQLSLEVATYFVEDDSKAIDGVGVKYSLPIFSDEDQMDVELKDAVPTVPNVT